MAKKNLFRKAALDRLASPEQLDQMIRIASPWSWIWLTTTIALLVMVIAWGFLGRIPIKVDGQGLLIKTGGIYEVVPTTSGQLLEVKVEEGDLLYKGQVVARVAQPGLREDIRLASERIKDLEHQRDEIEQSGDAESLLQAEAFKLKRLNLEAEIRGEEERVKWLTERVEIQEELLDEGLITKQVLLRSKEELFVSKEQIGSKRNALQQLEVEQYAYDADRRQRLIELDIELKNEARNLKKLTERLAYESRVVSPYTGRVIEIMEQEGAVITEGSPLVRLELVGDDIKELEGVFYLPPADGKKVRRGMRIQLAPSTVNVGEHGFIAGIVTHVSEYPSTTEGMMRVLGNEQMIEEMVRDGAPIAIQANLIPDPSTVSGYKWSSSKGPPHRIYSGTPCSGTVILEKQPPINLVMPFFKKFLSGSEG